MKYCLAVVILKQKISYFLFFISYFGILDVNSMYHHSQDNITNKVSTTPSCFQTSNDPYLKEEVRYQNEKENKQNSEIYPLDQAISSNDTTCPKITRSATTSDVQLLLLEKQSFTGNNEEENANDLVPNSTMSPTNAVSSPPDDDPEKETVKEPTRKIDTMATIATVAVARTKLKSCLRNPLRKKRKTSDEESPNKILKKKQSKKHICWEAEQNMNLIQNEEDGRGINSKILNMAIVASGPAFLVGGMGDVSRRSSNPETPKTILKQMSNDSAISFDFKPSERKSSLILNSVQAPESNLQNFTTNAESDRRRSSVMVTSLVKSLDRLGKYRSTFMKSSNSKPNNLHNLMMSAATYTSTTVLTTTTISEANSNIDTDLKSHSVYPKGSLTNSLSNFSNPPNNITHGGESKLNPLDDIILEESTSSSIKPCPASAPVRRRRTSQNTTLSNERRRSNETRRPSVHDEVSRARSKGILSPRFIPRNRLNYINGMTFNSPKHSPDLKSKKRSPRRNRNRRNSIRNASSNNLKSICT